jgi:hypothetical protein
LVRHNAQPVQMALGHHQWAPQVVAPVRQARLQGRPKLRASRARQVSIRRVALMVARRAWLDDSLRQPHPRRAQFALLANGRQQALPSARHAMLASFRRRRLRSVPFAPLVHSQRCLERRHASSALWASTWRRLEPIIV